MKIIEVKVRKRLFYMLAYILRDIYESTLKLVTIDDIVIQ